MFKFQTQQATKNTGNPAFQPSSRIGRKPDDELPPQHLVLKYWNGKTYQSKFLKLKGSEEELEIGAIEYYYLDKELFQYGDANELYDLIQRDLERQKSNQGKGLPTHQVGERTILDNAKAVFEKRVKSIEDVKNSNPLDYDRANEVVNTNGKTRLELLNKETGHGISKSIEIRPPQLTLSPEYITNGHRIPSELSDDYDVSKLKTAVENILRYAKNHNLKVTLTGHTDKQGDADYNLGLSRRRAQGMRDYMMNESEFGTLAMKTDDFGLVTGTGEQYANEKIREKRAEVTADNEESINKWNRKLGFLEEVIEYRNWQQDRAEQEATEDFKNKSEEYKTSYYNSKKSVDEKKRAALNPQFFNTYKRFNPDQLQKIKTAWQGKLENLQGNVNGDETIKKMEGDFQPFRKIDVGFERKDEYIK